MEYVTLNEGDLLAIAQDALRGRESDHFRISLLDEPNKAARLAALEENIRSLRAEVAERKQRVADEEPVEPEPNEPPPPVELVDAPRDEAQPAG